MIWYFINCNWVVTRWQQYSSHLHTNNTQNDTTIWENAGRAPSLLDLPWHLPYNWGKTRKNLRLEKSSKMYRRETDIKG